MFSRLRVGAAEQVNQRGDSTRIRDGEPVGCMVRNSEQGAGRLLLRFLPLFATEQLDERCNRTSFCDEFPRALRECCGRQSTVYIVGGTCSARALRHVLGGESRERRRRMLLAGKWVAGVTSRIKRQLITAVDGPIDEHHEGWDATCTLDGGPVCGHLGHLAQARCGKLLRGCGRLPSPARGRNAQSAAFAYSPFVIAVVADLELTSWRGTLEHRDKRLDAARTSDGEACVVRVQRQPSQRARRLLHRPQIRARELTNQWLDPTRVAHDGTVALVDRERERPQGVLLGGIRAGL